MHEEPKRSDEQWEPFDRIVSEYEGTLLRFVMRIVQDSGAAQDIVQDAFVRLFRSWTEAWKPSPLMLRWLYRVAHNCALDHLRRQRRMEALHMRHAQEEAISHPSSGVLEPTVSPEAERAAEALRSLSQREQQVVILKVYEEKSYREISEITGLSVSNVGYILHHAMKKLAEQVNPSETP